MENNSLQKKELYKSYMTYDFMIYSEEKRKKRTGIIFKNDTKGGAY